MFVDLTIQKLIVHAVIEEFKKNFEKAVHFDDVEGFNAVKNAIMSFRGYDRLRRSEDHLQMTDIIRGSRYGQSRGHI